MATIVSFHAHPDDETTSTGGTLARAAADGHRVVLVWGTNGEEGEPVEGVLDDGEELWTRRIIEGHRSAEILGAKRAEFLGYRDSGMMGEPANDHPDSFWQADVDEAAERLAAILRDERADVLTVYDDHGNYGHPDHIQIHRVGVRAAELAGVERVFAATMNRDRMREMRSSMSAEQIAEAGLTEEFAEMEQALEEGERPDIDEDTFGEPEANITHAVDVGAYVARKREAMQAHASQISADSFFMKMPEAIFALAFGTEWFIDLANPRPEGHPFGTDLFADLD
jgi:LmbE family N-acetylglucosaminyl deacetylase